MAIKTLKQKGYGIVEFNNFSSQRLGSKAQLGLNVDDFADVNHPCEQGMMLVYDEAKDCVRKATSLTDNVMFHKSEEKLYEGHQTLKDFVILGQAGTVQNIVGNVMKEDGTIVNGAAVKFYTDNTPFPRLYTFINNDTWTTNTVIYDDTEFVDFSEIYNTIITDGTEVWGAVAVGQTEDRYNGYVKISKTKPTAKVVLRAVKAYDLPDGQPALRFEVYSAQ